MNIYFSHTPSVRARCCKNVYYFKDGKCCLLKNRRITKHVPIESIEGVLTHAFNSRVDSFEILLEKNVQLDSVIKAINAKFEEEDVSIGLLTKDEKYFYDNLPVADEYHVTHPGRIYQKTYSEWLRLIKEDRPYSTGVELYDMPRKRPFFKKESLAGAPAFAFALKANIVLAESFHDKFWKLIVEYRKDEVEAYKRVGVSKQTMSNIRSNKDFVPNKDTIIALCIGLELSYMETKELLEAGGYTLSNSLLYDSVIIKYLKERNYNVDQINDELFERGLKPFKNCRE